MENNQKPEVWLRGPIPHIPALLQPTAHALMQAQEEIDAITEGFPSEMLWEKPAGAASVGFHLQHIAGVLDRLFTYARQESLNEAQLHFLNKEGQAPDRGCETIDLVNLIHKQIKQSLDQISHTYESTLGDVRLVGRSKIPSTLLGLLFHAAEHTQRHVGQLLVTARILTWKSE